MRRILVLWVLLGSAMSAQPTPGTAVSSSPITIRFKAVPSELVQQRLELVKKLNSERQVALEGLLAGSGCTVEKLEVKEQQPDLLCTLPGKLDRKIIVGAHYDHVKRGEGAVDNWSGAALLPSIYEALKALHLRHTVVFAGFSAEEQGLIGSKAYVARLTPEQQSQISAMVNLDTLGLSPTKVWSNRASPLLVNSLFAVASALRLPLEPMNVETRGASADSEPFFINDIPAITVHSVTEQTWSILHSDRDTLSEVKQKDYYDTYKLVVGYIVFLDQLLDASPTAVTSPPAS